MSTQIAVNLSPILLTGEDAAAVLGLSRDAFYRHAPKIVARHGLTPVVVWRVKKYSYEQLKSIVAACVDRGEPLYEILTGERE
jgi:hypothetical protein